MEISSTQKLACTPKPDPRSLRPGRGWYRLWLSSLPSLHRAIGDGLSSYISPGKGVYYIIYLLFTIQSSPFFSRGRFRLRAEVSPRACVPPTRLVNSKSIFIPKSAVWPAKEKLAHLLEIVVAAIINSTRLYTPTRARPGWTSTQVRPSNTGLICKF